MLRLDEKLKRLAVICLLSIPSLPALVNAASADAGSGPLAHASEIKILARAALRDGAEYTIRHLGPRLGLPAEAPGKVLEVPPEKAGQTGHGCDVLLDKAGEGARPIGLLLMTQTRSSTEAVTSNFRLEMDGTLKKAFLGKTRLDEAGNVVRGSGTGEALDISSPEVLRQARAELDFWLKRFPKAPAKRPASSKP